MLQRGILWCTCKGMECSQSCRYLPTYLRCLCRVSVNIGLKWFSCFASYYSVANGQLFSILNFLRYLIGSD